MKVDNPQQVVDSLLAQFKNQVRIVLNETADEFDARELTAEQEYIYNEFVQVFDKKVQAMKVTVQEVNSVRNNQ